MLPCQIKKKGKNLKKEKLIHNFHFSLQKSLNKNHSKGPSMTRSQSGLEMQLDLLKKIHLKKEENKAQLQTSNTVSTPSLIK